MKTEIEDYIFVLYTSQYGETRVEQLPVKKRTSEFVYVASVKEGSFRTRFRRGEFFEYPEDAIASYKSEIDELEAKLGAMKRNIKEMRKRLY